MASAHGSPHADIEQVRRVLELMPTPVTALNPDGVSSTANRAYLQLFGLASVDDLAARDMAEAMHPEDRATAIELLSTEDLDTPRGPVDMRVRHADGHWIRCTWLLRRDSATGWLVASAQDLTEQHARDTQLRAEARTDSLTRVANRTALLEWLETAAESEARWTLAVVDLDRFKAINDTFGHATGDEVLQVLARRIVAVAPEAELVARSGGDEFVVLFRNGGHAADEIGRRLTEVTRLPIELARHSLRLDVSVGISTTAADADIGNLLQDADLAVYEAKQVRGSSWFVADADLVARRRHEVATEQRLRSALGTGQFRPWFQPIVRVCDGLTTAYEALMRWQTPDGTVVPAGQFVELASNVGLVSAIGREIVGQTLDAMFELPPDITMAINLSPAELADPVWIEHVVDAVDERGVDRARITFEVTESSLIQDLGAARRQLGVLSDDQFRISLDDFGSGYSSLTYLTTLPIDEVKLDRALLLSSHESLKGRRAFEAVIAFVHDLGYGMVVEGVETEADHELLASLGVTHAQGWRYGRPAPLAELLPPSALSA